MTVSSDEWEHYPVRKALRAAPHFDSLRERLDPLETNPLVSMFTQDIPLGIMPYRSSSGTKHQTTIVGERAHVNAAVMLLESLSRNRGYGDIEETVSDTIREIAQDLAWHGLAPYEIWRDDIDEDGNAKIQLSFFTPRRLIRLPRYCLQIVPKADRPKLRKAIIVLPRRSLWLLSIPRTLGGYGGYKRTLRQLSAFDWTSPSFWKNDLNTGAAFARTPFDFSLYRLEIDIYRDRVARTWGWNGRDRDLSRRTEFSLFHRTMTFKWAQAVLREHIVDELNVLFKRLQVNAEIRITGLTSAADILALKARMAEGSISYAKAYEELD